MHFSPFSRHLIPLRPKYPPQHPVLKHPQSMNEYNNPSFATMFQRALLNTCITACFVVTCATGCIHPI
jgi:hypothetical protein